VSDLHEYQRYAVEQTLEKPYIGLFLEMGLGKTLITLTVLDELRNNYFSANRILVIAPLRVAADTWPREIQKWPQLRHVSYSLVLGSLDQRKNALRKPADIYIINRENVPWLVGHMGRNWNFDVVVVDELSSFKNHQATRFRALKTVRGKIKRLIGLTGTPAPNGLIDLWAQIYLLDEGKRLGTHITHYRTRYFFRGYEEYRWTPRKETKDHIYAAISDIVLSMESADFLDMPPQIEISHPVCLSAEGRKLYDQLENTLLIPYEGADVTAQTAAMLSGKLLQMASGAVYDECGGVRYIHDDKIDALQDIIEAANGKPVLVFYNYVHSLDRLQQAFPSARTLGKGAKATKDIADWNADRIPILLLHPRSAGHGLNLQESSCQHVIWFDQVWSLEENQQAPARISGGLRRRHSVVVIRLVAENTIDENVCLAVEQKAATQQALMAAVKARITNLGG